MSEHEAASFESISDPRHVGSVALKNLREPPHRARVLQREDGSGLWWCELEFSTGRFECGTDLLGDPEEQLRDLVKPIIFGRRTAANGIGHEKSVVD